MQVNELASRITQQSIRGDAVLSLPDSPSWSATLDPSRAYTPHELLRMERSLVNQRRYRASTDGGAGASQRPGALASVLSRKRPHSASPQRSAGTDGGGSKRSSVDIPGVAALQRGDLAHVRTAEPHAATSAFEALMGSHPLQDWPLLSPQHQSAAATPVAAPREPQQPVPAAAQDGPCAAGPAALAQESGGADALAPDAPQDGGADSSASTALALTLPRGATFDSGLQDDASTTCARPDDAASASTATAPAAASKSHCAPHADCTTGARTSMHAVERTETRPWAQLPLGPLEMVLRALDCSALVAASGACRGWRTAVLQVGPPLPPTVVWTN